MDKQTMLFLDRVALKMGNGKTMEAAMQEVCDDDKRIVSAYLHMSPEDQQSFADHLAHDVYEAARHAG